MKKFEVKVVHTVTGGLWEVLSDEYGFVTKVKIPANNKKDAVERFTKTLMRSHQYDIDLVFKVVCP